MKKSVNQPTFSYGISDFIVSRLTSALGGNTKPNKIKYESVWFWGISVYVCMWTGW